MKRIWALLLIFIVTVAAFTPCCTEDDCQNDLTSTTQTDDGKANDGSGCSPFFSCSTCPPIASMEKPITVPVPAEYYPQHFEANIDFISSTYSVSPWQPPRTVNC